MGWIEAEDFVVEAVGENDFARLADDEVVETVFCVVIEREAAEETSGGVKVNEFGFAEVVFCVGPDGGIARIETNAEDGKKMVAIGRDEIGDMAIRSDLNDFFLGEAAEIEDFAIGIPGETFRDEPFFFGDEIEAGLSNNGKIAVNFFDEVGEFLGRAEAGEFVAAGRIEAFTEGETFLEELESVERFAEVLFGFGEEIKSCAAVGIGGEKFFDEVDLCADFGGVGGFCEGAAYFFLLGLLGEDGDAEQSRHKERTEEADKGRQFHCPDFRREGEGLASSRTAPRNCESG